MYSPGTVNDTVFSTLPSLTGVLRVWNSATAGPRHTCQVTNGPSGPVGRAPPEPGRDGARSGRFTGASSGDTRVGGVSCPTAGFRAGFGFGMPSSVYAPAKFTVCPTRTVASFVIVMDGGLFFRS